MKKLTALAIVVLKWDMFRRVRGQRCTAPKTACSHGVT